MTHSDLIRWEPFLHDFDVLAGRFPQIFDYSSISGRFRPDFSNTAVHPGQLHDLQPWIRSPEEAPVFRPTVRTGDDGTAFLLAVELPGVRREDLDVRVVDKRLEVSGEQRRIGDAAPAPTERHVFNLSYTMPESVDGDRIEAIHRDGILTVRLPRTESATSRRIEIRPLDEAAHRRLPGQRLRDSERGDSRRTRATVMNRTLSSQTRALWSCVETLGRRARELAARLRQGVLPGRPRRLGSFATTVSEEV